ncbi:acetoacetate decarboxylase family protein [Janibacter melonis]|uniref:acetoacetate decarboxylase family protein n=1 Tax=Janibacter melonis TaxID=262209 RepID=UPI00177E0691|nr:hypothetical protein [Janibacter melonis]
MGYQLTSDEVAEFQGRLTGADYQVEGLDVWFTTTTEFLEEVLPPCFTAPQEPKGYVQLSGGVGAGMGEFSAATIYVAAHFGDVEGYYDLTMMLSGDMTVILGRELWGESKKRGEIELTVTQGRARGTATRGGVTVIDASGEIGEDQGPRDTVRHGMHLKAFLNSDATDLEYDPVVFVLTCTTHYETYHEGPATLTFASSPGDPCGSIPVVSVDRAVYGRRSATYAHARHGVEGREGYLPYVLGRSYDLFV